MLNYFGIIIGLENTGGKECLAAVKNHSSDAACGRNLLIVSSVRGNLVTLFQKLAQ